MVPKPVSQIVNTTHGAVDTITMSLSLVSQVLSQTVYNIQTTFPQDMPLTERLHNHSVEIYAPEGQSLGLLEYYRPMF